MGGADGDSYGVHSENNGPYGDAITQELMPAVEAKFRAIGEPWARLLTGGSTGGWTKVECPTQRKPDANIVAMLKDENWYELASRDHTRGGGQWDIWEATYGPVGTDGYPKAICNKSRTF